MAGALAKAGFVSGDTIDVAEGTYAQRPVFSTKGANLVGLGNGAIFDGGALGNASTMAVTGAARTWSAFDPATSTTVHGLGEGA